MKRLLLIAAATACLTSGCAPGVGINSTTLRSALVTTCGIVVDATTLTSLITAASQTLTSVEIIAKQVCDAFLAASAPAPVAKSTRFGVVHRQVAPITVYVGGIPVQVTGAHPL